MGDQRLTLDGLTPAELYVLGTAADVHDLFGLPEQELLAMLDMKIFIKAKRSLQRKKILTDAGGLTEQAVLLIEMLKIYADSPAYVRINDQMAAFRKERSRDLIVLTEQEPWRSYRLEVLPKSLLVTGLFQAHPFLNRKPTEEEQRFLLKEITAKEKKLWASISVNQTDLLAMEWMPKEKSGYLRPYSHFLYVPVENQLFRTDVVSQKTRKASLFYLYKELFDWLDIPYGQEAHAR
jgi:hypothetical protein